MFNHMETLGPQESTVKIGPERTIADDIDRSSLFFCAALGVLGSRLALSVVACNLF